LGDAHIYTNHMEQVTLQLSREPKPLPILKLNPNITDLLAFRYEDIEILNYDPHPSIKGTVAV
jgi:thymidylate synthase